MIRLARDRDLPQLMDLWQEAFGDSEEETAFYFEHRHQNENLLLQEDVGLVTGMLSMLPLTLNTVDGALSARYIFAVATRKSHRGLGVSTALLQAAHEHAARAGCAATLLVPAEAALFGYYEKRGYRVMFFVDEWQAGAADMPQDNGMAPVLPISAREYLALRDAYYAGSGLYAAWDDEALSFIGQSLREGGGDLLKIQVGGQVVAAACERRGSLLRVVEMTAKPPVLEAALSAIHRHYRADEYLIRLQAGSRPSSSPRPFGMLHWLSAPLEPGGNPPYLAFAKD